AVSGVLSTEAAVTHIGKGLVADLFGAFAVAAFIGAPIYLVRRYAGVRHRPRCPRSSGGFAATITLAWMVACLYPYSSALAAAVGAEKCIAARRLRMVGARLAPGPLPGELTSTPPSDDAPRRGSFRPETR